MESIPAYIVRNRIRAGWDEHRARTQPVQRRGRSGPLSKCLPHGNCRKPKPVKAWVRRMLNEMEENNPWQE